MKARKPKIFEVYPYGESSSGVTETYTPKAQYTKESQVAVPLWRSVISGLFLGPAVAYVLIRLYPESVSWVLYPLAVVTIAGLAWMREKAGAEETAWEVKREETPLEAERDVSEGHWPVTLRPPDHARNMHTARAERFKSEFEAFVRGCELNTSARRWEGTLGRDKYQAWRDKLIELGWAEWNGSDPRAGWQLVYDPDTILEAVEVGRMTTEFILQ